MSGSSKAIILVIILGLIAIVATLPAENPLKIRVVSIVGSVASEAGDSGESAARDKPVAAVVPTVAKPQTQPPELPSRLPFDEALSSGNKQVDALIKKANKGDVEAQYSLGLIYREGRNVQVDYVAAYMWLNIARAHGDAKSRDDLKTLTALMNNQQIAQGQKLASLWWDTFKR